MANLFSSGALTFPSSVTILLVVWSANGDGVASTSLGKFQGQLLNDDIYRLDSETVIMSSFGHNRARCALNKEILIYSTRKVLEKDLYRSGHDSEWINSDLSGNNYSN